MACVKSSLTHPVCLEMRKALGGWGRGWEPGEMEDWGNGEKLS